MRAKLSPESDQIGIDAEAILDDLCTSQIDGSIKWICVWWFLRVALPRWYARGTRSGDLSGKQ
jgi:hypothetical protein